MPGKDRLVRTVKLNTQFSTLIRPIQRVFPLGVNENDWKSLQLQGVQRTESAKSPNPDSSEANKPVMTRYSRAIRKLTKLNMLTLSDVFE
ncbi:DUF5641 domain-containing protein [Nephila pilipes]|uniref:DUF5641 domain-containing protein n=1 Tax=Nephila pilipes TaxID=299642 RepID=A0A8X6UA77_NEPPI|nr:DUF5641 domain-containing protein [Nephila pilipes]